MIEEHGIYKSSTERIKNNLEDVGEFTFESVAAVKRSSCKLSKLERHVEKAEKRLREQADNVVVRMRELVSSEINIDSDYEMLKVLGAAEDYGNWLGDHTPPPSNGDYEGKWLNPWSWNKHHGLWDRHCDLVDKYVERRKDVIGNLINGWFSRVKEEVLTQANAKLGKLEEFKHAAQMVEKQTCFQLKTVRRNLRRKIKIYKRFKEETEADLQQVRQYRAIFDKAHREDIANDFSLMNDSPHTPAVNFLRILGMQSKLNLYHQAQKIS